MLTVHSHVLAIPAGRIPRVTLPIRSRLGIAHGCGQRGDISSYSVDMRSQALSDHWRQVGGFDSAFSDRSLPHVVKFALTDGAVLQYTRSPYSNLFEDAFSQFCSDPGGSQVLRERSAVDAAGHIGQVAGRQLEAQPTACIRGESDR